MPQPSTGVAEYNPVVSGSVVDVDDGKVVVVEVLVVVVLAVVLVLDVLVDGDDDVGADFVADFDVVGGVVVVDVTMWGGGGGGAHATATIAVAKHAAGASSPALVRTCVLVS